MKSQFLRRTAWACAWTLSAIALFYAFENWRGARAWKAYQAELRTLGEPLSIPELLPPRPPDDLNVALGPAFAPLFVFEKTWNELQKREIYTEASSPERTALLEPRLPEAKFQAPDYATGTPANLAGLRAALEQSAPTPPSSNAASDGTRILELLRPATPIYTKVNQSLSRPHIYWPIPWEEGFFAPLPQMNAVMSYARRFHLRSLAHLDAGHAPSAFEDWKTIQHLSRLMQAEPTLLINHLVSITVDQISLQVLWQGLHTGQWSEAQLQEARQLLAGKNLAHSCQQAFRAERAGFLNSIIRRHDLRTIEGLVEKPHRVLPGLDQLFFMVRPAGWQNLERLEYARFIQNRILTQADPKNSKFHTRQAHENEEWIKAQSSSLSWRVRFPLVSLSLPALGGVHLNTARAQTALRQAALACALELHRRRHGSFPQQLNELDMDPCHLQDPVGEGALIYRREPNGGYLLYSLGWNQTDDGGAYDPKKRKEGDWPWRMPASP